MAKFKVWNLRQDMSHDLSRVLIFLIYISLVKTDVLIAADWTTVRDTLEFNLFYRAYHIRSGLYNELLILNQNCRDWD